MTRSLRRLSEAAHGLGFVCQTCQIVSADVSTCEWGEVPIGQAVRLRVKARITRSAGHTAWLAVHELRGINHRSQAGQRPRHHGGEGDRPLLTRRAGTTPHPRSQ